MDGVKEFELTAQVVQWEVAPGEFVEAYAYNGTVPGPLLRVTEGDEIRIVLKNELPEPTVLHLHGPRLPNSQDGVPDVTQPVIKPGETSPTSSRSTRPGRSCTTPTTTRRSRSRRGCTASSRSTRRTSEPTYDREYFQVVSEMGGFFVINGKAFPSTEPMEAKVGETRPHPPGEPRPDGPPDAQPRLRHQDRRHRRVPGPEAPSSSRTRSRSALASATTWSSWPTTPAPGSTTATSWPRPEQGRRAGRDDLGHQGDAVTAEEVQPGRAQRARAHSSHARSRRIET